MDKRQKRSDDFTAITHDTKKHDRANPHGQMTNLCGVHICSVEPLLYKKSI